MTRATIVILVLLRLAIGWHFTFEGTEKYRSETWSSEVYLGESSGPLAARFHAIAGDPLGERLTPRDPEKATYDNLPPRLEKEWQAWFDGFVKHYGLSADQKEQAQTKFRQAAAQTVAWILTEEKKIDKPSPYRPPGSAEKSNAAWVPRYPRAQNEGGGPEA